MKIDQERVRRANKTERTVCLATGQKALEPVYNEGYDDPKREAWWEVRVIFPGAGTDKRRVFETWKGKTLDDLWNNVLWGLGWELERTEGITYEWVHKKRYDRATKSWVPVDG